MRNGMSIRDLNGVEAPPSQFPLIGYAVFWRLAGIRVSHLDLERALQALRVSSTIARSGAGRMEGSVEGAKAQQEHICDKTQQSIS